MGFIPEHLMMTMMNDGCVNNNHSKFCGDEKHVVFHCEEYTVVTVV